MTLERGRSPRRTPLDAARNRLRRISSARRSWLGVTGLLLGGLCMGCTPGVPPEIPDLAATVVTEVDTTVGSIGPRATEAPVAPKPAALSGDSIAASLQSSGLPVTDVRVFTAETDPNHLLGRPGQYVAKVSWKDERGGEDASIELFADEASLRAREQYLAEVINSSPMFLQYMYTNPAIRAIVRVPKELTPDQAAEYERWLGALGR